MKERVLSPPDHAARLEQLEADLRQREHDLDEAQRIAHLGTWRWDVVRDIIEWSHETYAIFEQDPAQPPPRYATLQGLHTPKSWTRLHAAVTYAMQQGIPYDLDLEIHLPSGATKWITARGEVSRRFGDKPDGAVVELRGTVRDITGRKLQEQQLALSESRYRALVRASSDIVWTTTPDGNQRGRIPEWEKFTGQTHEQTLGYGWADAIHPDDRPHTEAEWTRALATGSTFEVEQRLRRHDGVYRTMLARAVPSRDADGNIVEWVGMHTDITERKQAEAALRETQSRFQRLFDSKMIGICIPDRFGAFHEGNDEFLRIVGYTRQELEAGTVRWDTMTPPEYNELDAQHIAEAAAHGSCSIYEKEYVRKDGKRIPILCGYALLEGSQDEYIGFVLDLTPLKQAESELRKREQRYRELADSLPQLIWEADPAGEPLYRNRRFEEYLGVPRSQMPRGKWSEYVHPENREAAVMSYARSLQTGVPYSMEYRLRAQDGSYRWFLANANPVRNADGTIERWIGTATDIDERKIADEALRRTEKLATAGRLAASIAHEINNPLGAVTNLLYLALQDASIGEAARGYLKTAEQELARVAHITTQTLQFHRQATAAAPADLCEIMDTAYGLFAARFRYKNITVDLDYRTHCKLMGWGDEMRQVFANLLSNSLDATRPGGRVRIRIREAASPRHPQQNGVRVTLADSGDGIPPEMRKRVFEPFLSTKENTGTGLGLWVTQGIVQKHHATLQLRSCTEPDRHGTVFSIFFPF